MEKKFYITQIERLQSAYGKDSYSLEVTKAIWGRVSHVKPDRFKKAIDYCLAENPKYPFGIDKIEVALSHIREERHQVQKQQRNGSAPSMDEVASAVKEMRENL